MAKRRSFQLVPRGIFMDSLSERFDSMFKDLAGHFPHFDGFTLPTYGTMEYKDEGDHYDAVCTIPGVDKEDINVRVGDGYLKVLAGKKEESDNAHRNFFYEGVQSLPPDVSPDADITAHYENGILRISIPKSKAQGGLEKEIEVT